MTDRSVIVTGGAGYVGSHTVRALIEAGYRPIVIDDLSRGHRAALPPGVALHVGDVRDPGLWDRVCDGRSFEAVFLPGLLYEAGQARDLAARIRSLLDQPEWGAGLGDDGRAVVLGLVPQRSAHVEPFARSERPPLPNWPASFAPQQNAAPSSESAQLWDAPDDTARKVDEVWARA